MCVLYFELVAGTGEYMYTLYNVYICKVKTDAVVGKPNNNEYDVRCTQCVHLNINEID